MRRRHQPRQSSRRPRKWTEVESVGSAEGKARQRRESARALREQEKRIMTLLGAKFGNATNAQLRHMAQTPELYLTPLELNGQQDIA